MINKKLFCLDMVMLAIVVALVIVKPGKWNDVLSGAAAALFVISITNHVRHYLSFKKFY